MEFDPKRDVEKGYVGTTDMLEKWAVAQRKGKKLSVNAVLEFKVVTGAQKSYVDKMVQKIEARCGI